MEQHQPTNPERDNTSDQDIEDDINDAIMTSESPVEQRIQDLQRIENPTNEEKAELQGLYAFPENPRGAELITKHALGTITQEENQELMDLQASRHQAEKEFGRI
jgi:hypothetical protein